MANLKRYVVGYASGGTTPRICIQQDATANFWNGGAFTGTQTLNSMTESFSGFFEYETSAAVFPDGVYNIVIYADGSTTSQVLAGYSQRIVGDTQMDGLAVTALAARNAASSLSAPLKTIQASLDAVAIKLGILEGKVDFQSVQLSRRG